MTKNTHRACLVLAAVFLVGSSCTTSSDVKNESDVKASAQMNTQALLPSPSPYPSATSTTASQKDGVNDVSDGNGSKPPTKLPGIDLTGVQLEVAGSDLKLTLEANDPFPTSTPAGTSALWQIEAWSKDKSQGYYFGAKLVESKWYVFIFNLKTYTNEYFQNPSVSGKKLSASFPLKQLPNLAPSFTWSVIAEYEGTWRDKIPNDGEASFPAS